MRRSDVATHQKSRGVCVGPKRQLIRITDNYLNQVDAMQRNMGCRRLETGKERCVMSGSAMVAYEHNINCGCSHARGLW